MTKNKTDYWTNLIAFVIAGFLNPAFFMWVWNWLQPQLAESLMQLGYWQSVGIYFISGLLFKGGSK